MRSIFVLSIVCALMSANVVQAQQTGDAISDGLAALLGRAQQGTQSPPAQSGTQGGTVSASGLIDATSPQAIVSLMQQAGYRAALGVDNVGDPKIDSSAAGVDFTIYFYGCTNAVNCQSLQFSSGYDMEQGTSFQTMNDWNSTQRFGYAYLDNESDPFVNMDVNLSFGVSPDSLLDTIRLWDQVLSDFQAHINW
jgi:type 1 fimbria pilin